MAHRLVVRFLTVAATALLVGSLGCQQTAKVAETPDTGSEWSDAPDTTAGNGDGQPAADISNSYVPNGAVSKKKSVHGKSRPKKLLFS